jgi:hypothetical protein
MLESGGGKMRLQIKEWLEDFKAPTGGCAPHYPGIVSEHIYGKPWNLEAYNGNMANSERGNQ